jgi:hypothetical protein
LVSEALKPVAGEPAGHEPNWQPLLPTILGGVSEDEVPDWFSAGEDKTAAKPAVVNVLTKVRTFCSAQPSSLETMTLKALASKGEATRSKAVQRMLRLEGMIDVLDDRLWVAVGEHLYRQNLHAGHLYTYMSFLPLHHKRLPG